MVRELAEYQAGELGYSVSLLSSEDLPTDYLASNVDVEIRKLPFNGKLKSISGVLGPVKPDESAIYHFHNVFSLGCLGKKPKNSICTLHGIGVLDNMSAVQKCLIRSALNSGVCFTAVDSNTASFFGALSKPAIKVIPNGLRDITGGNSMAGVRLRNTSDEFSVGFVGVLDELKGYRFILRAASRIVNIDKRIHFYFAGRASDAEQKWMREFCFKHNLAKNIHYIGEVEDAGKTVVPSFDLVVLPSRTEGLPVVLLEALRAGKPILATKVGGIPSLLKDGWNGFYIDREEKSITDAILRIRNNEEMRRCFSVNSRDLFVNQFEISKICLQYDCLYGSVREGAEYC